MANRMANLHLGKFRSYPDVTALASELIHQTALGHLIGHAGCAVSNMSAAHEANWHKAIRDLVGNHKAPWWTYAAERSYAATTARYGAQTRCQLKHH